MLLERILLVLDLQGMMPRLYPKVAASGYLRASDSFRFLL